MSLFKKKSEKTDKAKTRQLEHMGKVNNVLDTLENKGLIHYDPIQKKLLVASVLASIYLQSETAWSGFLSNVYIWALYRRQQEAWNAYFQEVELKAVRDARKKYASLSKAEIQEIRQKARMAVDVDAVKPPKVYAFEFFITDLTAPEHPVIAIGQYDGKKFEMASYEDVKRFLRKR